MIPFLLIVALAAGFTGAVAAVSSIGIGSVLTPIVAWRYGVKVAVAAVAVPHAAAMLLRVIRLRKSIDWHVLAGFGSMNAAGGLAGALLITVLNTRALATMLGVVLIAVGVAGVFGWSDRIRLSHPASWVAGALSGGFGGLVGSQGPIRSAAMLGLGVDRKAFVATATAIGLAVDGVRLPVYLSTEGPAMLRAWPAIAVATAAVLAGTLTGERLLHRIPERLFKRIVSAIIGLIGILFLLLDR